MNIQGKVALVTGGAVRVGKAITLMLARAGAHVVVNYNASAEAAEETAVEAQALGVEALPVPCDVADWGAVQGCGRPSLAALHTCTRRSSCGEPGAG
jgi:NAD(P)-dependent dehydrogenase (short-subunit alcohol dehydrogenase family)